MRYLTIREVTRLDLDSVDRTILHGEIIKKKKSLNSLYVKWYNDIKAIINYSENKKYIELGSGSGFIKEIMPTVITSDILPVPGLDMVLDATKMPFEDNSIDGIIMIDVFHHIPDVDLFLREAYRVLRKNGLILMSEPCNSLWSRFIYKNFHHEPFCTKGGWKLDSSNPLSSANGALPWIVFERDFDIFKTKYPGFSLDLIKYHTPLMYLISGGVSFRQFVPDAIVPTISKIDDYFAGHRFSMFVNYLISKR